MALSSVTQDDSGSTAPAGPNVPGRYSLGPGVLTDPQPRMLGPIQVIVRHGQLVIHGQIPVPAIRRGLRLYPDGDDPDAFRIELPGFGSGTSQVVFSRGPAGDVTAMHLGVQPLTFRKRPGIQHPTPRAAGALAAGIRALAMDRRLRYERAGSERPFGTDANDQTAEP